MGFILHASAAMAHRPGTKDDATNEESGSDLKSYAVWDASTRWFHWVNAICVIALAGGGVVILGSGALETSNSGKVLLKTTHTWIGYVLVLNLAWRFVWASLGNRYARWSAILPGGRGYLRALRCYLESFVAGRPEQYIGHNPAARLGISLLFGLITIQAISGLILAGTDLFYPPIGHWIATRVAAPGVAPSSLVPYAHQMYDATAYAAMRAYRRPIALIHLYAFYAMVVVTVGHVTAVVLTEIREGGGIISAMFTGRKILSGRPVDENPRGEAGL